MEFYRLHALVHDRFSSAVRRMDREYVGLYVRRRRFLYPILLSYSSDRQSSRKWRDAAQRNLNYYRKLFPYQVLNLFLALLLSNFGSSSLSAPTADQETNKIAEAFNRISRFKKWVKSSIANGLKKLKNKITNQISVQPSGKGSWLCLCVVYIRIDGWWFFSTELRKQYGNIKTSQFLLFCRVVTYDLLHFSLSFFWNWTDRFVYNLLTVSLGFQNYYNFFIITQLIKHQHVIILWQCLEY